MISNIWHFRCVLAEGDYFRRIISFRFKLGMIGADE